MLQLVILTGESNIVKNQIFTDLEHFNHDLLISPQYSEFFGFTESEIDDLISNVIQLKPDLKNIDIKKNVKNMYNGYLVGRKIIYNPWSIIKCLSSLYANKDQPFRNFLTSGGSVKIIENALKNTKYTEKFEKLLIDGCIEFEYEDALKFEEIYKYDNIFFSFLMDTGI